MQRIAGLTDFRLRLILVASLVMAIMPQFAGVASASTPQFGSTIVRLSNLDATNGSVTQYTGGSVCVTTPASVPGTETDVDVGFPDQDGVAITADDFQVSTTLTNWITSTTPPASPGAGSNYWPSGATAWPTLSANAIGATDTAWSSGNLATLKVVRFSMAALSSSTTYCFDFKDGSGTPGAETGSTYSLQNAYVGTNGYTEDEPGYVATYDCSGSCAAPSSGTLLMESNWATQMVPNDQIVVSATVPPIFEFSLTGTTDSIPATGNLNINNVNTSFGVTAKAITNGKGGWIMWAQDKTQALVSASSSGTIGSVGWGTPTTDRPTTLAAGTAGYALDVTKVAASGTTYCSLGVAPEYDTATYGGSGGAFTSNFAQIGQCTGGPSSGDGLDLQEDATISATTPAATDYTDIITVVGAGSF